MEEEEDDGDGEGGHGGGESGRAWIALLEELERMKAGSVEEKVNALWEATQAKQHFQKETKRLWEEARRSKALLSKEKAGIEEEREGEGGARR
ncbi:hypothetical protein AAFF_G00365350 [Aldrovandia affinis]|uniref:Uncharacterized protein n=1 Tax=Aldrovandia affinis TaxID=143900 RepID=A0AAD7VZC1_9TELE|nr:hypothetical protein AAFF_G00365350 [Aldrovandia affinis]